MDRTWRAVTHRCIVALKAWQRCYVLVAAWEIFGEQQLILPVTDVKCLSMCKKAEQKSFITWSVNSKGRSVTREVRPQTMCCSSSQTEQRKLKQRRGAMRGEGWLVDWKEMPRTDFASLLLTICLFLLLLFGRCCISFDNQKAQISWVACLKRERQQVFLHSSCCQSLWDKNVKKKDKNKPNDGDRKFLWLWARRCYCTWIHLSEKQLYFLGNLVSAATSRGY